MSERNLGEPIRWYRCPVSKEDLAALNRRSDLWGFLQTGGYLGVLALTGGAAFLAAEHGLWYAAVPLVLLHGACWHFMINGFHELIHDSVFKTRALNRFFLWVFSFLGHYNHVHFWASHTEHHKFTLHPPDDLEVVQPQMYTLKGFLKTAVVNLWGPWHFVKGNLRVARGKLDGEWTHHLFDDRPKEARRLRNWARFMLAGHFAIVTVSLYFGLWMIPLLVTLAPYYGGGLQFLCNAVQHTGLSENTPDFRVCCRTIYINPVLQFLYWHMNYHTEHHMYAAVPCYHLPRLHRLIRHDMPPCPNGLYRTWKHVGEVLKKQQADPTYRYVPELPGRPAKTALEPAREKATVREAVLS